MPLFPPPLPAPLTLIPDGAISAGAGSAITAGSAYAMAVTLYGPMTIAQMRTAFSGAPTGNVDMGIYDATAANSGPNNLLAHTGVNVAATGLFTKSLTASVSLSPGVYWLALLDTVADSVWNRGMGVTSMGPSVKTTATNLTVLGATFGVYANNNLVLVLDALQSGGWS